MLTVAEVKQFLNINDAPDGIVQDAVNRAAERIKSMLAVDMLPDEERIKRAWLYLACSELAPYVNAYYRRGDNTESLNAKMFASEAERLLGLVPKSPLVRA